MCADSLEVKLCTSCGSTQILENYPAPGLSICAACGGEVACVPLKVISDEEDWALTQNYICPHCHKDADCKDVVEDISIVVLKCCACGELDGYKILPSTGGRDDDINDGVFGGKAVALAKDEGRLIFSAAASKRIDKAVKEKEKDPLALCRKKFRQVLEKKTEKLIRLGVASKTIEEADYMANYFITRKGPFTDKQLECLLSAAVILAQDKLLLTNNLACRVSERKISEIFSADRVTTRKWKKMLMENRER